MTQPAAVSKGSRCTCLSVFISCALTVWDHPTAATHAGCQKIKDESAFPPIFKVIEMRRIQAALIWRRTVRGGKTPGVCPGRLSQRAGGGIPSDWLRTWSSPPYNRGSVCFIFSSVAAGQASSGTDASYQKYHLHFLSGKKADVPCVAGEDVRLPWWKTKQVFHQQQQEKQRERELRPALRLWVHMKSALTDCWY